MPAGDPREQFFIEIRRLVTRAGSPSIRNITERSRTDVSRQTVGEMLRGRHIPRWHYVSGIIEGIGGDPAVFRNIWQEAYSAQPPPRDISHTELRKLRDLPVGVHVPAEYQQMRVGDDEVADTCNELDPQGWQVLHVWPGGGNTVKILLRRYLKPGLTSGYDGPDES